MNDPARAFQLLEGFYEIENGQQRWTTGQFSIEFPVPPDAGVRGASLSLAIDVPAALIAKSAKSGSVTLVAAIGDTDLASQTYRESGAAHFTAEIRPKELTGETVTVDFALDRTMRIPPDVRVLGLLVTSAEIGAR